VLRSLVGIPLLCFALAVELVVAILLVDSNGYLATVTFDAPRIIVLGVHLLASLLAAVCISALLQNLIPGRRVYLVAFLFLMSALVPFLGAAGSWLSMAFGAIMAKHRHKENVFWQFTSFDSDTETLYNKVVASRHIRDSQSAPILKSAVGHSNELEDPFTDCQ